MTAALLWESLLLGVGLSMDAFSVSLANGLRNPEIRPAGICSVALVFAGFQGVMPMVGWACVHRAARLLTALNRCLPWLSLLFLTGIGWEMIHSGLHHKAEQAGPVRVGLAGLLTQGVATSVDALSVGFATAACGLGEALCSAGIIAAVTFLVCAWGLLLGRKAGTKLSGRAEILGGLILIFIGLKIFLGEIC